MPLPTPMPGLVKALDLSSWTMLLVQERRTPSLHVLLIPIQLTASTQMMLESPVWQIVCDNKKNFNRFDYLVVSYTVVCANGDLRLAGSTVAGQGRVEICINETWGTICDDSWGTPDASVACQVLGFSRFG